MNIIFKILTITNSLFVIWFILNKIVFRGYCFVFPWIRIEDCDLWIGYKSFSGSGTMWSVKGLLKKTNEPSKGGTV